MNKKWYRNYFSKGLWIIIEHLTLVVVAICLMASVLILDAGIRTWEDSSRDYLKSEALATEMYFSAMNILHTMNRQVMFLDEGEDGKNVIDLREVDQRKDYTFENTSGLAYSVADLKKWADSSWSFYDGENILVCLTPEGKYEYFYCEDFKELIRAEKIDFVLDSDVYDVYDETEELKKLQILTSLEQNNLPDGVKQEGVLYITDETGKLKYKDVWNFGDYALTEKYAPDGADSILDVINENEDWNGKLTEAYNILDSLLRNIQSQTENLKLLDEFKEGNTNLTYIYVDLDNKKVYSNDENVDFAHYSDFLESLKKESSYVMICPILSECSTDLKTSERLTLQNWKQMVTDVGISDDYIFMLQVDKEFPIADSFAEGRLYYDKYAKWQMPIIVLGVVSALIFLTGLVWLTIVAGRKPEDEEIHLCWFDRWFTEIAGLTVFCIWVSVIGILSVFTYDDVGIRIVIGVIAFFSATFFLTGYLSLVRRIKGKTLWKGSLLYWIFCLCKRFWSRIKSLLVLFEENAGSKLKMVLLLGGFMILQFVLCGILFSGGTIMLLVLLALDVAVIVYYLRSACGEEEILHGLKRITDGELQYKIPLDNLNGDRKRMAEYINRIGEGLDAAVESSLKNERMKTELITNVSHDIKTPLTSIINYIDLLKRENFTDPKICGYLDVLEAKAQRLKVLTEDVVEASKASTGNISLEIVPLNFVEMINQVIGEFEEKFAEKNLTPVIHMLEKTVVIYADGRRMWRVLENVFNNAVKYAMEGTRVYIDLEMSEERVVFSMKNISAQALNISADELTERFIRGDVSRNTEGSGLGLSIAKSLTELQGGTFKLYLDGDLFKVIIAFDVKK